MGVRWYPIVVLIGISLMTSDTAAWAQISRQDTQPISQTGEGAAFILMGTQEVSGHLPGMQAAPCRVASEPAVWQLRAHLHP